MTSAVALFTKMDRNGSECNQMRNIAYNLFVKGKNRKKSFRMVADGQGRLDHLKHRLFFFWPKSEKRHKILTELYEKLIR